MASVFRTTARWDNFLGAPGFSKLSFTGVVGDTGAVAVTAATRTFFNAIASALASGITIQVQNTVQEHDEVTGRLIGELTASATPAVITGTAAGAWTGGAGAFIAWKTGTIWQGRRVQGRTFLVPLCGIYDTNGTLSAGFIATLQSAGNALIADANTTFALWAKTWDTSGNKPVQINGAAFQVLTAQIKDQASQLRSRRN